MARGVEANAHLATGDPYELAWAAGFFDGEGSVFLSRQKRVKNRSRDGKLYDVNSPVLSVSQVDRQPLARFALAVGGREPGGPYTPRGPNSSPYHRWDAQGRPSVHRILSLLWPYLSDPKKQAARRVWAELESLASVKSPPLPPLPEMP